MGQGCSGNLSDVLSDPANNSSEGLNGSSLQNGHSRADKLWRHSHSKRIHELLESYSAEDVQRLLVSLLCVVQNPSVLTSTFSSPFLVAVSVEVLRRAQQTCSREPSNHQQQSRCSSVDPVCLAPGDHLRQCLVLLVSQLTRDLHQFFAGGH